MVAVHSKYLSADGKVLSTPVVIVGLGNDIAGDDGAGLLVARRLAERLSPSNDVTIIELPWAGFNLLDVLPGHDRAILIDSLQTGHRPPGTLVRLRTDDLSGSVRFISYHDINYPTVLSLGKSFGYRMPRRTYLLGIEIQQFDTFSRRISPAVRQGVERATKLIERLIRRWRQTPVNTLNRYML